MTLLEMLEKNFSTCPSKTAIIYNDETVTHSELYHAAIKLGSHFIRSGIRKGDRVAMMMDAKIPELITGFLGAAACGAVVVPVDCNQTDDFIRQLFGLVSPRGLIATRKMYERFKACRLPLEDSGIIVCRGENADALKAARFEEILEAPGDQAAGVSVEPGDTVYLNLTSGTTGFPKCAVTTHANIYWNTRSASERMGLTHEDRHLCMFPPATHPHELFARALFLGGTMVLTDHIAPKSLTAVIEENQVTAMMAIAPIYGNFTKCHKNNDFQFTTLKKAESGGMHLDPITAREFRDRFGFSIVPVWGSTETAGIALGMPDGAKWKEGSCGVPNNYYQAGIIDKEGNAVPAGEVGEMVVKGPGVCSEYFENDEETQKSYRDGWYRTGDMFWQDKDGFFYFSGRRQGMMKVAGMKVFPVEIEDLLIQHPLIKEVAVTKARDPLHGEIPKAIIVPEPGSQITKKEIRAWCASKLAPYKIPKVVEYREHLPRNPVGKILVGQL